MFGDYEIIETVGQGGMGVVYRAKDTSLGRIVALKVLKNDLRAHKSLVARFQREAEAYATLNHPNIVHIYSVGAVGQIPYIAMEFIEGGTLSVTMKRERRIPWERALKIAEQIAEALGSAHQMGIIHRDIKPGNIMLTDDEHAFVTDFGIAKVLTAETQLTIEGSRLGTPQYMSPERCRKETGSPTSDLYSLGIMLFQMISARLPYESKDVGELIRMIVVDPPKRLSDFMPDIPKDVERLVAYLIEKKPKHRPQSGEEWAALSRRVRAGKELGGGDVSIFQSSLDELRENMTPSSASDTHYTIEEENYWWRIQSFWLNLPMNIRAGLVGILVVMLGLYLGRREAEYRASEHAGALALSIGATEVEWKDIEPVASFYDKKPGLSAIHLSDKTWIPTPLVSVGEDVCIVKIEESDEGEYAGRIGLIELNQQSRAIRILVPPTPLNTIEVSAHNDNLGTVTFQMTSAGGEDTELYAYSIDDAAQGVHRTSLAALWGRLPYRDFQRIGAYERVPETRSIICAGELMDSPGEWGLYILVSGQSLGLSLVKTGEAIQALELGGQHVAFSRSDANGVNDLYVVSTDAMKEELEPVLESLVNADSFSYHPSRDEIVAVHRGPEGNEAVLVDVMRGDGTTLIPGAVEILWHPDGVHALVLAPDEDGVLQVWQMLTRGNRPAEQLSDFEDGVRTLGTLFNEDNRLLVSGGTESQPALMLIDLP